MVKTNKKIIQFFACLANDIRIEILLYLKKEPRTVNEIHNHLGKDKLTLSAISHQLKQMSDLDIIDYEKKGRKKYFNLSTDFCWCILNDVLNHYNEKK